MQKKTKIYSNVFDFSFQILYYNKNENKERNSFILKLQYILLLLLNLI